MREKCTNPETLQLIRDSISKPIKLLHLLQDISGRSPKKTACNRYDQPPGRKNLG